MRSVITAPLIRELGLPPRFLMILLELLGGIGEKPDQVVTLD